MSRVGVVVIGHGTSATSMLAAARTILAPTGLHPLADVVAIDAGLGKTPELSARVCDELAAVEDGAGVLLLVDLLGASPCSCGQSEARVMGQRAVVLAGLNLAMLLKLATVDREGQTATAVAEQVADSARRAVAIKGARPQATEESG